MLLLLIGCVIEAPSLEGGQTGEEMPPPCVEARAPVGLDDNTLGFSAADVLDALAETGATLTWPDGVATPLSLSLAADADGAERIDLAPDGEACLDLLAIPALLRFRTADGAFDEAWPVQLLAWGPTTAEAATRFDEETLAGGWAPAGDPDSYVAARWEEGAPSGRITDLAALDEASALLASWSE